MPEPEKAYRTEAAMAVKPDFDITPVKLTVDFRGGNVYQAHVGIYNPHEHITTKEARRDIEGAQEPKASKLVNLRNWLGLIQSGKALSECRFRVPTNYRWPAGGLLTMLSSGEAVLLHRDAGAPSYGDHLTAGTGLGRGENEIYDPRKVILREGLEEIMFLDNDGFFVPDLSGGWLETYMQKQGEIEANLRQRFGRLTSRQGIVKKVESRMLKPRAEIVIADAYIGGREDEPIATIHVGSVNIDPQTRGIDALNVLQFGFSLDDIKSGKILVRDAEGLKTPREIVIAKPQELVNYLRDGTRYRALSVRSNGEMKESDYSYPLTPVTVTALTQTTKGITQTEQMELELKRAVQELEN